MKVAIIGAGISGLSCAAEFEKNGITPNVFEKKSYPWDQYDLNICMFNRKDKSCVDPLEYLLKEYGVELKALATLKEVILCSKGKEELLKDNFAYVFKRGREEYSLGNQLAKRVKTPINYDNYIGDRDELMLKFDHIIVAEGNYRIANNLKLYSSKVKTRIKIANVLGNFEIESMRVWFNKKFSKDYYGYMLAHSKREALITLVVENVSGSEMEYYWKEFLNIKGKELKIVETSELEYEFGRLSSLNIGNTYFVGNSAGLTDDFLGSGVLNSIESGILAARSIIFNIDYSSLIKPLIKDLNENLSFRKKLFILNKKNENMEDMD